MENHCHPLPIKLIDLQMIHSIHSYPFISIQYNLQDPLKQGLVARCGQWIFSSGNRRAAESAAGHAGEEVQGALGAQRQERGRSELANWQSERISIPIGSMYAIYMVTWIPSIYPSHVSIYIPAPWILWDMSGTLIGKLMPILGQIRQELSALAGRLAEELYEAVMEKWVVTLWWTNIAMENYHF